jgi:hypothetical protein
MPPKVIVQLGLKTMTDRYPPPSYAATIWLSGETLMLALPEASTIQIPLSRPKAIEALLAVLRVRAQSRTPSIGEPGAPIRNDVEKALESDAKFTAWLAAMNKNKAAAAEAKDFLFSIGL